MNILFNFNYQSMNFFVFYVFFPIFIFRLFAFPFSLNSVQNDSQLFEQNSSLNNVLKINVISSFNGKGLEKDLNILSDALEILGHHVKKIDYLNVQLHNLNRADINIFIEVLVPELFPQAKKNWFIPNPEWFTQDIQLLNSIDLILCRTHEVERIFKKLNKTCFYLGFTSEDCYRPEIKKKFNNYLHIAGESPLKGTEILKTLWTSTPSLPYLTVIRFPSEMISNQKNLHWISQRIPQEELRILQNQCGIHLCPSESEGFGHSLMEAMSTGAVILTTDAPPMNEFIQDPHFLIPYIKKNRLFLGKCYQINPSELKKRIIYLSFFPKKKLEKIGLKNRKFYLQKKQEFSQQLALLLMSF